MSFKKKIFLWVGVIGILGIGYNAYHWFDGLTQNRIGYVLFQVLKNEKLAFQFFKWSAGEGCAKGALNLGHSYFHGHGTERDLDEARIWLLKSALPEAQTYIKQINAEEYANLTKNEQPSQKNDINKYKEQLKKGDPEAQYFIGVCNLFGICGEPTDYETGYKLIQASADAGNKNGKAALGWCYFLGAGIKQNDKKAFEIFEKYAKECIADAEAGLGFCYMLGRGVSQNDKEAFIWTKKAAEHGDKKAACNVGVMFLKGTGVEKNIDEGIKWIESGAEYASAEDQRKLGYDYKYSSDFIPQNLERAAYWYKKAADKGNCCGLFSLGVCYVEGTGVQQSYEKGFDLIKKAKSINCKYADCYLRENYYGPELKGQASAGDSDAQLRLGRCFLEGLGVEKRPEEAFRWIKKGAEQGNINALNVIGILYENGIGTPKNGQMAVDSFKKASDKGNVKSQMRLGYIYLKGELVDKNIFESLRYFDLAAKAGEPIAQNNLAWIYATSTNPSIRNGEQAVLWAQKAIATVKKPDPSFYGTLAAAYAESGQFQQAIDTQEKAISMLQTDVKKEEFTAPLNAYRSQKPWRDD